ncbi:MAG: hypothetical protein SPI83_00050 [Rothia sp. (in: high G+C Gram-positive bacteria)]|nr:hypothetical protein [Rothia sp. (in: high G+C Gram-positive bacteria)]
MADVLTDSAQLLAEQEAYDLGEAIRAVDAAHPAEPVDNSLNIQS